MKSGGNTEPIPSQGEHGPGGHAVLAKTNISFSTCFYSILWCYQLVINATCSLVQLLLQKGSNNPSVGYLIWHQVADRNA